MKIKIKWRKYRGENNTEYLVIKNTNIAIGYIYCYSKEWDSDHSELFCPGYKSATSERIHYQDDCGWKEGKPCKTAKEARAIVESKFNIIK